jgi:hypothetical protein
VVFSSNELDPIVDGTTCLQLVVQNETTDTCLVKFIYLFRSVGVVYYCTGIEGLKESVLFGSPNSSVKRANQSCTYTNESAGTAVANGTWYRSLVRYPPPSPSRLLGYQVPVLGRLPVLVVWCSQRARRARRARKLPTKNPEMCLTKSISPHRVRAESGGLKSNLQYYHKSS